ncbi:hypothetical protein [Pseudomonas sp. TWI929]|uniref:hypothetical protein n=1 Tax=Pseudomonas sp. TWI929 TaxID=3136795 RepID=UPI003207D858
MPKIRQYHVFRLMDLLSLVASNAYTACVAGMIAFSSTPNTEVFFPVDKLAMLALVATLLFELVAVSVWVWHSLQCNKVLKAAGLASTYLNRKALNAVLTDPVHRQQYSAASQNKSKAMGSIALCALLLMAGMITAMYLSNTSLTPNGWVEDNFGYGIYAAPLLGVVVFFIVAIIQHRNSLKDEAEAQKWIRLADRLPKAQDIQLGYVKDAVLCRSPHHIKQWGGRYTVIKIVKINGKHMPPPGKRDGIEWTQFRR